jgi:uncharacterized protein (DUF2345 family)
MPVHFTDRLQVTNEATGQPVPYHAYTIQRGDGSEEHGVTDANGFTHMVSSHVAETIKLFVE